MKLIFCMQISMSYLQIDAMIVDGGWLSTPDAMIVDGGWLSTPKVPKIKILGRCHISEEKLEMKLIFCMQINTKIPHKLILILCASKFPAR